MPELPEVEVICRGLRPHLLNHTVLGVAHSGKALRQPIPIARLEKALPGRRITEIERRAKYIQLFLDSGAILIIHLGMTGNLGIFRPSGDVKKHDHLRITLDNHSELRSNDSRRFGIVQLVTAEERAELDSTIFKTTGPEPFSDTFSVQYLMELAANKETPAKVFIMNSQVVAGVGNIYASESLFRAGILPMRRIRTIKKKEWSTLIAAIREVLQEAITCGGSTISDYVNASQERGYFQMHFRVYDKAGDPCPNCQNPLENIRLGGRASYFCRRCQK